MFKLGGKKSFVYVSGLRMCQLFTVLTGVISKSLKKLSRTYIGSGFFSVFGP